MLVQYGVGSAVYAGVIAVVGWRATFDLRFVLSVSWMVLVVSIGATLLLFYMLAHDLASRVSTLFFLVPILAMSADHWVFGNPVSRWTILGSLVVLASMVLYRRTSRVSERR
jgi:drug/metabolite transporter (DMT)-like permease